jgi:hypothetical protein
MILAMGESHVKWHAYGVAINARGGVFGGHEMDKDKAYRRHVPGKHVLVADTMKRSTNFMSSFIHCL